MIDLGTEIAKALKAYTAAVEKDLTDSKDQITKKAAKRLRTVSPKLTGSYRKGWRVKKEKKPYIIHNKTDYQLTHLLEKGHATAGGGRTRPIVHIETVEQEAVDEFIKAAKKAVKQ